MYRQTHDPVPFPYRGCATRQFEDFLDIVFRLEKAFSIKIPRSELFPEDVLSSTDFVVDGKLNDAGIAALKERMPFVDLAKFEADPSVQNFPNILTVEDMVRYVQSKLGG